MDPSQARRRRRGGSTDSTAQQQQHQNTTTTTATAQQQRLCSHCGRSFKRSEHLERHVRTRQSCQLFVHLAALMCLYMLLICFYMLRPSFSPTLPQLHSKFAQTSSVLPPNAWGDVRDIIQPHYCFTRVLYTYILTPILNLDTKEKPYICHCGSAFSRRDLLTRHQRISHESATSTSPDAPTSDDVPQVAIEPDSLSAADLTPVSDVGVQGWIPQPHYLDHSSHGLPDSHYATAPPAYQQHFPTHDFFGNSKPTYSYIDPFFLSHQAC